MVELTRSLRQGKMKGGLDASVKSRKGSTAWKITSPLNMKINMYGKGAIDGNSITLNSTRTEREATVDCLWAIMKLAKKYEIKPGACSLYIDNQGSYKQEKISTPE